MNTRIPRLLFRTKKFAPILFVFTILVVAVGFFSAPQVTQACYVYAEASCGTANNEYTGSSAPTSGLCDSGYSPDWSMGYNPIDNVYRWACVSDPGACEPLAFICGTVAPPSDGSTLPASPTNLWAGTDASCGSGRVNVSWSTATGATSYQLYRGPEGALVYNGADTSFNDTGLADGRSVYYAVFASNSTGQSPDSGVRVYANAPAACPVTSPPQCVASSGGPPTCENGTLQSNYDDGYWFPVCTGAGVTVTCPVTGQCGSTDNSCATPGAAQNYSGPACGRDYATWTCSGSDGGSSTSCYLPEAGYCPQAPVCGGSANTCAVGNVGNQNSGSCGGSATWTCSASGGSTSCSSQNAACGGCTSAPNACGQVGYGSLDGYGNCNAQTPSMPYSYGNPCQSSSNACGQTNWGNYQCNGSCSASAPSDSSCVSTPSAPNGFWAGASSCGTGQINLSWNTVSGATYYTVYRNGQWIYSGGNNWTSDYGLSDGQTYNYSVTASNSAGTSGQSWTQTNAPGSCLSVPNTPTGFWAGASSCGTGQINLSWNWV
ncbi:MAG: hypothetical protein RLZZ26_590, partial [Candidatus Parcubacteria bacterium]